MPGADYLVRHLFELGPYSVAGLSEVPIGWQEMLTWQQLTGIELEPWEARALRRMSAAYVEQLNQSRDPNCPAPWSSGVMTERTRAAVDKRLRSIFNSLISRPPSKAKRDRRKH